jgi:DNA-binding response OmpR family regulator
MATLTETKKILIVDDDPVVVLNLSYSLRSPGVEVVTASRLESAEAALDKYFFDLVVADIRMSGILGVEGLELLSYVKKNSPKTKVIILSGSGSEDLCKKALERGADQYYDKPIDIAELMQRVKEMGIYSVR